MSDAPEAEPEGDGGEAAPPPPPKPRQGRLKALIAVGAVGALVGLTLIVASMVPTRTAPLRAAHPAFRQAPKPEHLEGCGLNERSTAKGCERIADAAIDARDITFASGLKDDPIKALAGTLAVPKGLPGRRPAAVLIGGSGPTRRDSTTGGGLIVKHGRYPLMKRVAETLTRQGLVTLRYDKRACAPCYGGAMLAPERFRFRVFIDDARAAVAHLRTLPEVDPRAIVVVGHSQGGQFAPFVARESEGVAGVVMLAGTTQTFEKGLVGQLERLQRARVAQLDLLGALQVAWMGRSYGKCFDKLRHDFDPAEQCLGGGITQQALHDYEADNETTLTKLKTLDAPLLALFGNLDQNIDPAVADTLQSELSARDASVERIDGMGHSLTDVDAPKPDLHPKLVEALGTFLARLRKR